MSHSYDVIIIGTGAGGSALAHRLADGHRSIVILERGYQLPRERENHDPLEIFARRRYQTKRVWLDPDGVPFRPLQYDCLGGNTKAWGGTVYRLRESDFLQTQTEAGISPAWPLTYSDLAPYYEEAERLYCVHGQRGEDPSEPPMASPYPYPPLEHEPRIQELSDRLFEQGLRPFRLPMAFPPGTQRPQDQFRRFDGYPDPSGRKIDAQSATLDSTLKRDRVELRTGMTVLRLETSVTGREIAAVVARDDQGRYESFQGSIVVCCCGAYDSAILLLSSANGQHPKGLANGSGWLGRNAMRHHCSALTVVLKRPNTAQFQKTLGINDYYLSGGEECNDPLGQIHTMGRADEQSLVGDVIPEGWKPGSIESKIVEHGIGFFLVSEDLPDPENQVRLRGDGQVQLHYRPKGLKPHRLLIKRLLDALDRAEGPEPPEGLPRLVGGPVPFSAIQHQSGTLRFGRDPRDSVLDPFCRTHEVDNLYCVDSGFFPSSTACNPALTIVANALRVGDHLAERLGASPTRTEVESTMPA